MISENKARELEELLKDSSVVEKMKETEDVEEIRTFLEEKGVSLSLEELLSIAAKTAGIDLDAEISESELENVAGGFGIILKFKKPKWWPW